MLDTIISIITAVAAIIAPIIAIVSMSRKTNDKIDNLIRTVGTFSDQTLCGYLKSTRENDLGKTNEDRSLTGQHKDMQSMLQKEIDTAERRYTESEARIRNFTAQQHNMAETINQFRLFMESWERLASENSDLKRRIVILENQVEELSQHSMNAADQNFTEVQEGGDDK